jgi:hypothetical protein
MLAEYIEQLEHVRETIKKEGDHLLTHPEQTSAIFFSIDMRLSQIILDMEAGVELDKKIDEIAAKPVLENS